MIAWKSVYVDYYKEFHNSTFQKESLKVKLRETLKELKTCTSNEDNSENDILQPIDFLTAIKITKGHVKKHSLNLRTGIVEKMSPSSQASDSSTIKDTSATTSAAAPSFSDRKKEKTQV